MLLPSRGSKAFTLLELIVVIVILGILAAIAIPTFQKVIVRSQDSATETTLAALLREAQALAAFENRDVTAADIEAASEDLTIQAADAGVHAANRKIVAWVDGETGAPTLATRTDLLYKVDGSTAGVSLASASGNCVFGQVKGVSAGAETWVGTATSCTGTSAVAGPGSESAAPAPAPAPSASLLNVVDTFDRANSTVLGTTSDTKATWTAAAGTWNVTSNQALLTTKGAANNGIATIDVGSGDVDVSIDTISTHQVLQGLVFRYADESNYLRLRTGGDTNNYVFNIDKVVAGTPSTILSLANVPSSKWRVSTYGSTIKIYRSGEVTPLRTITETFNQTATKVGIYSETTSTAYPLDNFKGAAQALTAPEKVAQLNTTLTTSTIDLTWPAVTDADLAKYKVYRDGAAYAEVTAPTTSYSDASIVAGKAYSYEVAAVDQYGNEGAKSPAQIAQMSVSSTSIQDTFDRANSTSLGVTSDGAQTWQALIGSWNVTSNQAHLGTKSATGNGAAVVSMASGDVDVSVDTVSNYHVLQGLVFRASDANNYLRLRTGGDTNNYVFNIDKVVAGTPTTILSLANVPSNKWRVKATGSTIEIYRSGETTPLRTITETFNQTATKVGIYSETTSTAYPLDNFKATSS